MPGSRLRMRAAPSNSWSIAPKIGPLIGHACRLIYADTSSSRMPRKSGASVGRTRQRWERETLAARAEEGARALRERSRPSPAARSSALYTADDRRRHRLRARPRRPGRVPLHARHPSRPATAASCGRCGSSPGSARPRTPTRATRRCCAAGGTGLSVAFDLPTLMGRDPDHELSLGEVGKCGVSVASLADMETLFDGIAARRHHDVDDDQLAGAR